MAATNAKLKNFETNYKKLEDMVQKLESPDLTLQQSLDLFEKAVKLSRDCEGALDYARQRAQMLADMQDSRQTAGEGEEEETES